MGLSGQVAIVTGGSRGIGRAICTKLAQQGAKVVVNYNGNEALAKETVFLCESFGVDSMAIKANVSDEAQCIQLFEETKKSFGRVDIVVNNAGITRDGLLMRMKKEEFSEVIDTNLTGCFFCMKHAATIMMKQRYGRIINISSIVGLRGNAGQVNYAASKAGVIGMTKSAAKELAKRNITVNAVAPGMIQTDMTDVLSDKVKEEMHKSIPCGRIGSAQDVANAVSFFAAQENGYITGQVLCVDGGMAV